MAKRQIVYNDLTGGLNNVDTKERLNSSSSKTETPDIMNIEYLGLGGIKTMEGNTQVGDIQNNPVVGGHEYVKNGKRYMVIALKNGEVKLYNKATNEYEQIFKFKNSSDKVSFCDMNNGVVVSNGVDDLLFYEIYRNTELTGNVNIEDGSKIVNGISTTFGTDVKVGDYIRIQNANGYYKVENIINKKSIEVSPEISIDTGVKYFAFEGKEIDTTLQSPDNLKVDINKIYPVEGYNELTTKYSYEHNGYNNYSSVPSINYLCGNIYEYGRKLNYTFKYGSTNITRSQFCIYEGKLYLRSSLWDNEDGWTQLTSGNYMPDKPFDYVTYGIKNGKLYFITNLGIEQIGTDSGYVLLPNENGSMYSNVCPVIKSDGTLYYIKSGGTANNTTVTKVGTSKNWYSTSSKVNQISSWCGGFTDTVPVRTSCIIINSQGKAYSYLGGTSVSEITNTNNANWEKAYGYSTQTFSSTNEWVDSSISQSFLQRKENGLYNIYICSNNKANKFTNDIDLKPSNNEILLSYQDASMNKTPSLNFVFTTLSTENDNITINTFRKGLSLGTSSLMKLIDEEIKLNNKPLSLGLSTFYQEDYGEYKLQICLYYSTDNDFIKIRTWEAEEVYDFYDIDFTITETDTGIYSYPYFTKRQYNNDTQIGQDEYIRYEESIDEFINEGLSVNGIANLNDEIIIGYNILNEGNNVIKYTNDIVNSKEAFSNSNKDSKVDNIINISNYQKDDNIILLYKVDNGNNNYTIFDGIYNQEKDEVNTYEQLPTTNLQYYLSPVSELNAYLVNTNPDVAGNEGLRTPIRGTAIQFYNGRLWVGTKNGIFYSAVGLPNNWDIYSDAGVLYSIYNDSSKVSALGLFSEYLTVHKEFSTYILTCSGESSSIEVKPFSNITCESQQGWIVSNTKYFVFSKDFLDIYPLIQHTVWSDKFLGVPISQKIRNLFKKVKISDTDKIFCVSRPRERQMMFYMPLENGNGSNIAIIYDFQTNSWLIRKVPQNVTCAFQFNNKIYIGTNDGKVLEEFKGTSFDGKPIEAYYKSPWFDWVGDYTQSFSEFFIEIDNLEHNEFIIDTQKDGISRTEERVIDSDRLDDKSLVWAGDDDNDEDNTMLWDDNDWLKTTFESIRMLLPNNVFEDFQLKFFTNKLGQLFRIFKYGFRRIETEEAPW